MQLVFARVHGLHLLCVTSRDLLPFEYGFGTQVLGTESPNTFKPDVHAAVMTNNALVYGSFGVKAHPFSQYQRSMPTSCFTSLHCARKGLTPGCQYRSPW